MKNFGKTTDIRDIITVGYEADNAVLYSTSQSLTNDQKIQARANIGAGTSNFDGDYDSLANKPTIPTKTSQLENDSNFATTSQVEAKYTKPSGGIPKTDLATAVQNSLTAADNAVKYTNQSLTDAQKDQARKNIGAGTSSFSGSYDDLTNKPSIPAEVSIVQSIGESTSSVMSQKATTNAVNGRLSKTDNVNIEVLGTKKSTTTLGGNQLYAPNGVIFGGTAAAAGLVTRGICGITTPSDGGACSKENLYINYDGNNDFNAGRQVVLSAGTVGNHLGSNMYQYTVPRGEIVKNWVEAKGYATTSQVDEKQNAITDSNKLSSSLVDGLGAAAAKDVDTAIAANSTSTNLPTSKAVEDRINAHSGIDKVGTVTSINANGTSFNPDSTGKVDLGNLGGGSGPLTFADVVVMTEAEFSEAYLAGTLQDDKLYLIEGETGTVNFVSTADHIVYNNANSGLTATNLQSAVDEMCQRLLTTAQLNKLIALLDKLTVANDSVTFNTIVKATTFDVQ